MSDESDIRRDFPYAELVTRSNFSFLRGASHPEELVEMAARQGYAAVGLADRNSLAGVVRAHVTAKEKGIRLLVGARLVLMCGFEVICYPRNRAAYGRLSKLLTRGNRRTEKGSCELYLRDLKLLERDMVLIVMPPRQLTEEFRDRLSKLRDLLPGSLYLAARRSYDSDDTRELRNLAELADSLCLELLATNDVLYHTPGRRPLQDILTCIREHVTIDEAGLVLKANAERYPKHPTEMYRRFRGYEDAVRRTVEVADLCSFSLDELAYQYPDEPAGDSPSPQAELERLTWIGAAARWPEGPPDKIKNTLAHELRLIGELDYAPYFLTVYDLVRFARSRDILCQGRGSAANSAVCYCLGITSVDPARIDLLFERFISAERNEPPDIDVDFEHERREEVIQYIYQKYGRHRAGIATTVVSYRTKMAVREVGKAMGLSEDVITALSAVHWDRLARIPKAEHMQDTGLDFSDVRLRQALKLAGELLGFPRHLSQHVGGFVITRDSLEDICPVANAAMAERTHVEWDKDDLAALRILKIDVLSLGMLTCIRKAFALLEQHYYRPLSLATVPAEDPAVYDMICKADTVGVFQIESRAQMSMLPRLRPRNFYDLVIEIAIVRPGPIQGDMVHPYLRRRQGLEQVSYPSRELENILGKTLGVPLFQEQAMSIAIVGAGFSPGEADQLRRAMATFRRTGTIGHFRDKFISGMEQRGYSCDFAERCFKQIEGFSDYGFPESHSASFALLAYVSSWLKCHYPLAFACALLNSLPMGFYSSGSIVRDLREHGGKVLPPDINLSSWDHLLEEAQEGLALRLGFRQIKGVREQEMATLTSLRERGYDSVRDLYFRTGLSVSTLERLAHADGFSSLGLNRREALWAVQGLGAPTGQRSAVEDLPLYAAARKQDMILQREQEVALPRLCPGENVMEDYASLRLSLKAHPVSFLRTGLRREGYLENSELASHPAEQTVSISGLVLVRQRPGTASGVIFLTLEDETAVANAIVWPRVFENYRRVLLTSRIVGITGTLQREQEVMHVIVDEIISLDDRLSDVIAEEQSVSDPSLRALRRTLPEGRNFH